jgi:predicted ribosomally synthesized peptide with SipW-like signal peptide
MTLARSPLALIHPRVLMGMALVIGLLGTQAGGGTLAYFTSSAAVTGNVFTAGTLTASTNSSAAITWDTAKGGTDCAVQSGAGSLIVGQRFVPGIWCVGPLTLSNSGNVDSDMRLRLVRTAGSTSAPDQTLNNLMTVSMYEAASSGNLSSGCTTSAITLASNALPSSSLPTGFTVVKDASNVNVLNTALTGITATDSFTAANTANAASSYVNLLGTDSIDGSTTGTSATLSATGTRYFCAAVLLPIGSLPTNNTSGDNAAQAGTNTYAFHMVLAQKANRS